MPLPDFLIVGAARSGTTALHFYLQQHPEIAMSAVKEPNHFIFEPTPRGPVPRVEPDSRILAKSTADRAAYAALFRPRQDERVLGEASPLYLYVRESPAIIAGAIPHAKIIVILRDPVDRAYSHFLHVDTGSAADIPERFAAAVERERPLGYSPYRSGSHALRLGRYGEQLACYTACFGADQLHLVDYDDFDRAPQQTLAGICRFLGVDDTFAFDTSVRHNPSGAATGRTSRLLGSGPRRIQPYLKAALPPRLVSRLVRTRDQLRAATFAPPPPVDGTLRATLIEDYYGADLRELARRTGMTPVATAAR